MTNTFTPDQINFLMTQNADAYAADEAKATLDRLDAELSKLFADGADDHAIECQLLACDSATDDFRVLDRRVDFMIAEQHKRLDMFDADVHAQAVYNAAETMKGLGFDVDAVQRDSGPYAPRMAFLTLAVNSAISILDFENCAV